MFLCSQTMEEGILELDRRGILPFPMEDRMKYYIRGHRLKFANENCENIEEKILDDFGEKVISPIDNGLLSCVAKLVDKKYGFDLSWVRGFYADIKTTKQDAPDGDLEGYIVRGRMISQYCKSEGTYDVPPTVIVNPKGLNEGMLIGVLSHELIHVPRGVFQYFASDEEAEFEEEFASSLNPDVIPYEVIDARRILEESFGGKAGYVLGRLSYSEISSVAYSNVKPSEIIKYLSKNDLRMQIIAHRLGL